MSKCSGCLFSGKWQDMGASAYVCTLESDLCKAIARFDKDELCDDKLTKDEALKYVQKRGKENEKEI